MAAVITTPPPRVGGGVGKGYFEGLSKKFWRHKNPDPASLKAHFLPCLCYFPKSDPFGWFGGGCV